MPEGEMLPEPMRLALNTAFVELDAEASVETALHRLTPAGRGAYAIVRRVDHGRLLYYLFDTAALAQKLARVPRDQRPAITLQAALRLREDDASPTADDAALASPGTVVVSEGRAVGFVAPRRPRHPQSPIPPSVLRARARSAAIEKSFGSPQRGPEIVTEHVYGGASPFEGLEFGVRSPSSGAPPPKPTAEPAAPAADASPPGPPRFFNARTPSRVALDTATYVYVQVATEPARPSANEAAAAVGEPTIGSFAGELTIDVHAPGLEATSPTTQTLRVPQTGDSGRLRFGFVARTAGVQPIDVMAWNGSAQVAGLTLQVGVATEPATTATGQGTAELRMREPDSGEYTLDVAMEADRRYRFQLRSDRKDVWPPMHSEPLLGERQATYDAMVANLNAQARNLYHLAPEDQAVWLRGMGKLLFEQLVPEALKTLLQQHRSRIRVLNILSPPDSTPWELLYVCDPDGGEGGFLAESAVVARWRYGAAAGPTLKPSRAVFVLPADAPAQAQAELDRLRQLLGGDSSTIGDLTGLNRLMNSGGFGLLHFAAHNVVQAGVQGGTYVPFGKNRWDLAFLAAVPADKFKPQAPLVFMNACTSAGTTALYTDLSNWADRFLKCGSGGFIGTLWEVRDTSARKFSETFYRKLVAGATLGDAMQSARAELRRDNPGDPTPLAYTLYGNPLARLETA